MSESKKKTRSRGRSRGNPYSYRDNDDGSDSDSDDLGTINVAGEAMLRISPNLATIQLTIMTRDMESSLEAQSTNAARVAAVIKALQATAEVKILHTDVTVQPRSSFAPGTEGNLTYHEARTTITLETQQLGRVASLIDAAMKAGEEAVRFDDLEFKLDDATKAAMLLEVLLAAAENAKNKARLLAKTFNSVITGVARADEQTTYHVPMGRRAYPSAMAESQRAQDAPAPSIDPGAIELRASLSLAAFIKTIPSTD